MSDSRQLRIDEIVRLSGDVVARLEELRTIRDHALSTTSTLSGESIWLSAVIDNRIALMTAKLTQYQRAIDEHEQEKARRSRTSVDVLYINGQRI